MSRPRVRPTFHRPLDGEPREFFTALAAALDRSEGPCRGLMLDDAAILRIDRSERRIWSPSLHLHIADDGARGQQLHGKFCPSSPVWTAFVAIYIGLFSIALMAGCYGYAQWTAQQHPWAFYLVGAAVVLTGLTYGAAFLGQGLGAEDMYELRSFVDRVAEREAGAPS